MSEYASRRIDMYVGIALISARQSGSVASRYASAIRQMHPSGAATVTRLFRWQRAVACGKPCGAVAGAPPQRRSCCHAPVTAVPGAAGGPGVAGAAAGHKAASSAGWLRELAAAVTRLASSSRVGPGGMGGRQPVA